MLDSAPMLPIPRAARFRRLARLGVALAAVLPVVLPAAAQTAGTGRVVMNLAAHPDD